MVLDENIGAFVVRISFLELKMSIYLVKKAQLALQLTEKVTLLVEYSNFADIFSEN